MTHDNETTTPETSTESGQSELSGLVMCGFCKNCKHWTGDDWHQMKTCTCNRMDIGYSGSPETAGYDGVLIEGDEGWGWFTAPEFGCVHFEHSDA